MWYLRLWLAMHITTHRKALLRADLAVAAALGAPHGLTLSAMAHCSAAQGHWRGLLARALIDACWHWLFSEPDHCRKSFEKRTVAQPLGLVA